MAKKPCKRFWILDFGFWILSCIRFVKSCSIKIWRQWAWSRLNRNNRWLVSLLLTLWTGFWCVTATPVFAKISPIHQMAQHWVTQVSAAQRLEQQGKELYDAGRFTEAAAVLQQAAQAYQAEGNRLRQAIALGNLALTYQQLSQWSEANRAIASSLQVVHTLQPEDSPNGLSVLAQVLDTQGNLQLSQGQAEQASTTWEHATVIYEQMGDREGAMRSRINQSQAMQARGLYRRAIATLEDVLELSEQHQATLEQFDAWLRSLPVSPIHAVALQSLGDALRVGGELSQSRSVLQRSLAMAQALQLPDAIAAAQFSLGNTARAQGNPEAALTFYQDASASSAPAIIQVQAQLNQLSLFLDQQRPSDATILLPQIRSQLDRLPLNRTTLDARLNLAHSLIQLSTNEATPDSPYLLTAAQLLTTTQQHAQTLGYAQAESYAFGMLAGLYEQTGQWVIAQSLTEQALQIAQSTRDADTAYRWQWQLGRLRQAQGDTEGAIAAYDVAVATLESLRRDVVTSNLNYQLSFRQRAEDPVYRDYIDLLLQPETPSQAHLKRAREVITSLQVAELENFLQEPCGDAKPESTDAVVDRKAQTTAVFYPIILSDRLEVILKLPGQENLEHYRSPISAEELQHVVQQLQLDLEEEYTFDAVKTGSQKLYNWLIQPVKTRLDEKKINTLVFALDSFLRSVPMAALYDGEHYLMENYAIAIVPELELQDPQPLTREQLKVLAVGLTEPPANFSINFAKLTNINAEIDAIADTELPVIAIRDQRFTRERFNQEINDAAFPVVHLATHGQFSSDPQDTFLLTSNGAIAVNELDTLFRIRGQIRPDAIELLILSACETAAGDELATLGIAGTAVRAGARSTIASLWTLDDVSSVEFTSQFYQNLGQPTISKADALRRAQLALLANPQYEHPRYWATYVLVGNWL
jgi:CHAT domain-containing protein